MIRRPVWFRRALLVLVGAAALAPLVACGKKGPPLPPLRLQPARVEDLTITRRGDEVRARFTVPAANSDGSKPADLAAIELYGLSGKPEDPLGQTLSGPDFVKFADEAGRADVQPPPDPNAAPADATGAPQPSAKAPAGPTETRPAQGEPATIVETLTAAKLKPWVHPRKKQAKPAAPATVEPLARPLAGPPAEEVLSRFYGVAGISSKGEPGGLSNRVALPLIDPPASPSNINLTPAETSMVINWEPPPGARRRVQLPPEPGMLAARALVPGQTATTYNVYLATRVNAPGPDASGTGRARDTITTDKGVFVIAPTPINPNPVEDRGLVDRPIVFGQERCYAITAVSVYGNAQLESAPSPIGCVTPLDSFPPAAPTGLAAVGSEGGVSLIWEPNSEADLAGYLVLRGEVPAAGGEAKLAPLMQDPIKETTYRDTTAAAGVRYVYAVVAVDTATPHNTSPPSNRVEESAR